MDEYHVLREEAFQAKHIQDIRENRLNFANPTKRSFLNECIRQLHFMNGNTKHMISMPAEYNKTIMWHKINNLMRPIKLTEHQKLVKNVKRRLFLENEKASRKCKNPQRNTSNLSDMIYFKSARYILGTKKIPRNYLNRVRKHTQIDLSQQRKRKPTDLEEHKEVERSPLRFNIREILNADGVSDNCPKPPPSREEYFKRVRYNKDYPANKRAKKLEEMSIEQQYHQLAATNDQYLEASIRSLLYMKTLMCLIETGQHADRNIYA